MKRNENSQTRGNWKCYRLAEQPSDCEIKKYDSQNKTTYMQHVIRDRGLKEMVGDKTWNYPRQTCNLIVPVTEAGI
jgi:hypothetical protein